MTEREFRDRFYAEQAEVIAGILNDMTCEHITSAIANIAPERLRQEVARRLIDLRRLAA